MHLPPALAVVWRGWQRLGHGIGMATMDVLLILLWVVVFGLYAAMRRCSRIFAKHPGDTPHWLDVAPRTPDDLHFQF